MITLISYRSDYYNLICDNMADESKIMVLPKEQLDYFKENCGKLPAKEIIKELGISQQVFLSLKKRYGFVSEYNPKEKRNIVREHYKDMTFTEMAKRYGGSISQYSRHAKSLGLCKPQILTDKINRQRIDIRSNKRDDKEWLNNIEKISLNKKMTEETITLTIELLRAVESYVNDRRKNGSYSCSRFFSEIGISSRTYRGIIDGSKIMSLDNAIRIVNKCGLTFKIAPTNTV